MHQRPSHLQVHTDSFTTPKATTSQPALQLPLRIKLKVFDFAPQGYVYRMSGRATAYIRQKPLRFKEEIEIFTDKSKQRLLYRINADRVWDFKAQYHFFSVQDGLIGRTQKQGVRSLIRTQFDVLDDSGTLYFIKHKNVIVEFIESFLLLIPIIGSFLSIISGYILNPVYEVTNLQGDVVAKLTLKPSFWESKYELISQIAVPPRHQELIVLSMITMIFTHSDSDDGDSDDGDSFDLFD